MMIGTAAGIATVINFPMESGIILIGCSIFGSLVPDVDHPKSKLNQKILPVQNKFFKVFVYLLIGAGLLYLETKINSQALRILGITLIITGLSQHRGFTHSILGLIFYTSAVYLAVMQYGIKEAEEIYIGFAIGYISHLLADFMTKGGIPIFYPFGKNISFPIAIKTGGVLEKIILLGTGIYSVYTLLEHINLKNLLGV